MACRFTRRFLALSILCASALHADPIKVRQSQGTERGFLLIRSESGVVLGHGDLIQTAHGSRVTSELALHFKDGSLDDETVVYTQTGVFRLISDHHIQKGPFFHSPVDLLVQANGDVTNRSIGKDGKEKVDTQHLDLPPDVYNGMIGPLLSNISPTTQPLKLGMVVAAGDKVRLVHLNISPTTPQKFSVAGLSYNATVFRIHIELGGVAGVVAPIVGKQPGDIFVWVVEGAAPQFMRMLGPLANGGPAVSIELSGASFRDAGEDAH